jgi:hypothetical protein
MPILPKGILNVSRVFSTNDGKELGSGFIGKALDFEALCGGSLGHDLAISRVNVQSDEKTTPSVMEPASKCNEGHGGIKRKRKICLK